MTKDAAMDNRSALNVQDITLIGLFTAVMAVCSWISIPATVPFTLQTFAVFLTCGLLGGRRGTLTVLVYLLLGAIGLPVFSGFTGGIGHLAGPTGGYIIGFIFSALVMWLGEQIDIKGIGNGISILLFAGILSRGPQAFEVLIKNFRTNPVAVVGIVIAFFVVIGFIVWMTDAERRIPVQYAKRVVGNKMYGGQNTHIPIKVNMSGVMPIIFASSILMLPTMILSFAGDNYTIYDQPSWHKFLTLFSTRGVFYAVIYFIMIIAFAYFYTTIQFNPVEMANNLRKNGGAIPGIRPGKPSSDFISKILSRITLIGALFLSVIAILPIAIGNIGKINVSLGGTSILIMVGVALDTVKNLESQMMMRHYKGFLD